jgi:hypothetical protein
MLFTSQKPLHCCITKNPTWRFVRLRNNSHLACKTRRGQQTPFSGVVRQVGLYLKIYNPSRFFRRVVSTKKWTIISHNKGTNFSIKVPNNIENIFSWWDTYFRTRHVSWNGLKPFLTLHRLQSRLKQTMSAAEGRKRAGFACPAKQIETGYACYSARCLSWLRKSIT